MGKLIWEELKSELRGGQKEFRAYRSKIPGGWLLSIWHLGHDVVGNTIFYPDPTHDWTGDSLPDQDEGDAPPQSPPPFSFK